MDRCFNLLNSASVYKSLNLRCIIGIYTDTEVARLKAPAKRRSAGRFQRMRTFNAVFLKVAKVISS